MVMTAREIVLAGLARARERLELAAYAVGAADPASARGLPTALAHEVALADADYAAWGMRAAWVVWAPQPDARVRP